MIEAKTVFYIKSFNAIGGVEQWMYYIAKKYGKTKDFIVLYRDGDRKQLERLIKYCNIRMYCGEKVKCENAIFCYGFDIIDKIEAKNYYHFIHGNMEAVRKIHPEIDMIAPPQITKQYSVSNITRDGYKKVYGIDTEVFYNIVELDAPTKPKIKKDKKLRLITASRLKDELKGFDFMEQIAEQLKKNNIDYEWLCFSDKPEKVDGNFTFMKPTLDITNYIQNADYLVQTSRDESYGYSIVEALCLNVPVIVMNIPVLKELKIRDGKEGYILDFDMKNLDVNKINKNIPIIKGYKPPTNEDKWELLFGSDIEKGYVYNELEALKELNVKWEAIKRVKDDVGVKYNGEEVFIENSSRVRMLLDHNLIRRKK